jgi:hypothetical protein
LTRTLANCYVSCHCNKTHRPHPLTSLVRDGFFSHKLKTSVLGFR